MNLDLVKEYTLQEVEELAVQTCPICQNHLSTHRDGVWYLPSNWWVKCSKCDFRLTLLQWQDGMFTCFGINWQYYTVALERGIVVSANHKVILRLPDEAAFDFNKWLPKLDKILLLQ